MQVVHFRSVTEEISQGDIMSLAVPHGQVDNLLQMRHKNQVLRPPPPSATFPGETLGFHASFDWMISVDWIPLKISVR